MTWAFVMERVTGIEPASRCFYLLSRGVLGSSSLLMESWGTGPLSALGCGGHGGGEGTVSGTVA